MSKFDFWQHWGADLDDSAFANAWAALGIVAAAAARRETPRAVLANALERARKLARERLAVLGHDALLEQRGEREG